MIHPVIYGTKREFSETLCPPANSLAIVTNMGIVILTNMDIMILSSSPLS